MKYSEKIVAITGAAVGIGRATAEAFVNDGAAIAVVDRDVNAGTAFVAELTASGKDALFISTDVSNPEDVKSMIEGITGRWGRLDIFVNNAGIYTQGDIVLAEMDDWNRIIAVNLTGAFLCSKYAAIAMVKSGGGVIINVASEAGLVGIAGQVAYNVSKAGMIALTRSCAVDLASRNVRVNCVCPGTTDTPLVEQAINRSDDPVNTRRKLESSRPLNRLGKSEEIASAILYLSSDIASYATGSILSIDGGYTAQ